jgi:hypothetical protein
MKKFFLTLLAALTIAATPPPLCPVSLHGGWLLALPVPPVQFSLHTSTGAVVPWTDFEGPVTCHPGDTIFIAFPSLVASLNEQLTICWIFSDYLANLPDISSGVLPAGHNVGVWKVTGSCATHTVGLQLQSSGVYLE